MVWTLTRELRMMVASMVMEDLEEMVELLAKVVLE